MCLSMVLGPYKPRLSGVMTQGVQWQIWLSGNRVLYGCAFAYDVLINGVGLVWACTQLNLIS